MLATYTVYLSDRNGTRIKAITDFVDVNGAALHYGRSVNSVSPLQLVLPFDRYKDIIANPEVWLDSRLEVWRKLDNGLETLDTETVWLVRQKQRDFNAKTMTITAYSANEVLNRRRIAYPAGTSQALKTAAIDNMMKSFVRENLGSSATDSARSIASYLTVESDQTKGISVTKAGSYDILLDLLQDLAAASSIAGSTPVPIFFDVIGIISAGGVGNLEFRTYANQRGQNRTYTTQNNAVVLSPDTNTLQNVVVVEDYSGEYNVIYALGNGQGSNRVVTEVKDSIRIARSPINRRETTTAENTNNTNVLTSAGNSALRSYRPKKIVTANIANNNTFQYGKDWQWGDKLSANIEGDVFDIRVDAVDITVSGGVEKITANLRAEV